ncbi:type III secretion system LEE chaperone CesT [Escherichia coli]|uniref:type III secretion system LEE chaperone CesT n=1 Tax=Escherichia coli TaxID=562 RepID=UPI0006A1590E|nr:type III secretion system LEE chaperone CesT [Escherichia coli]EEX9514321.1 type III secretion system LEE chaperone CesT [Escherichia coli]CTV61611.1 chaperone CesT [Escherichia coli]CTV75599.1 chaperone CesT [Escherichia coli]
MSSRSELLLDRFAEKIGIGSISFNENRLCSFAIDEIYYISLSDANDEYMMIYGVCGKFPTDNPNFALDILNANLWFAENGGPYLCYESGAQSLLLALRFPLDDATPEKLENEIEVVVKSMENLYLVLHNQGITLENEHMKIEEISSSDNKHYYAGR